LRLSIWALYLILFPIQLLPQGSPQIADYFLLIGMIYMFVRFILQKSDIVLNNYYLSGAFLFSIYSLGISLVFYVISLDFKFLIASFNYIYCFLCLYYVAELAQKKLFFQITFLSIIITLGLQLFLFFKTGLNYDSGRYMIMFQNPNQLGFWGLIIFLILLVIKDKIILKRYFFFYGCLILSSFFILVSISQAAILSLILILLFLLFRKSSKIFVLAFLTFIISIIVFLDFSKLNENLVTKAIVTRFESDLLNKNDNDNNLEARNYSRIWENPEYLIFGAGESGLSRFGNDSNEIHSTFGSLLFSFGLIGFLLFFIPLLKVSLFPIRLNSYIFMFFLLFTLAHNVLRWPLFWIIPYLMFCIKKNSYVRN